MDYPVTQQDILLCTLPNRVARLKVELLTMQGQTLLELTSETIDGGLTIESESDVRRIVDLTLECINETYNFGADKRIWFDKKIGLSYGILAPDDVWHDYPLGVFAFTGANFSYDEKASQLKIAAADLMAFTLQDRGSQIGASEVVIEVDSNIRNAMIETLKRFTPLVDYAITEFPADQQVVPYDVSVDSGAYPHDIIKKLRDLYPNYETYIDAYGTFVCNKIPERTDDPLFLDETVIDPLIISEQVRTDFNVRNVTEIWGAEIEPDRTMQHCSASGSVYNAGFTSDRDLEIVIQPDNIRAELDGTVYFSVNAVGKELEYQWQWSDNGTTWSNSTATGSNTNTLTIKAESRRNSYLYRCVVSEHLYDGDRGPVASKSGEVITVSDAGAFPVHGLTLYGRTEQTRTTGAQLFNASKAKNNDNVNVELTEDSIKFTVVADGQYRQIPAIAFRHFDKAGDEGTFSISYEAIDNSNLNNAVYIVVYWYQNAKRIDGVNAVVVMEYPKSSTTFTCAAPIDDCDLGVILCANKATTALAGDTVTIKNFMISETSSPVPYEPYTGGVAGPSSSYPLELKRVGTDGEINIMALNEKPPIIITAQPAAPTGKQGDVFYFRVRADGEKLSYQWEASMNGGKSWANSTMASSSTDTLTLVAKSYHNGYLYRCKIQDAFGDSVYSNTVMATVGDTTPAIRLILNPANVTAPLGETVSFKTEAMGTGLTYQWEWIRADGTYGGYSELPSAATSMLEVPVTSDRNGQGYRCRIEDSSGNVVFSDVATLTVAEVAKPKSTQVVAKTPNGFNGMSVSSGGNYIDSNGQQRIADTIEYDYEAGTLKRVRRVWFGQLTSTSHDWAMHSTVAGRFYPRSLTVPIRTDVAPLCSHFVGKTTLTQALNHVYINSAGTQVCFNTSFTTLDEWKNFLDTNRVFLAYAMTAPIESDLSASSFSALSMQNPNTILYNEDSAFMDVSYWIENPISGSVVSDAAVLTIEGVAEKPRIVKQPQDAFAKIGGQFEFTVEAVGVSNYQWQFRYNANADWQDSTWATANDATQKGTLNESRAKYDYRCLLTGVDGTYLATNTVHVKEIDSSIEIIRQPVNAKAILGEIIYFSVSAKGATGYQWQRSADGGKTWTSLDWNGNDTPVTYTTVDSALVDNSVYRCLLTAGDQGQMITDVVYAIEPTQYVYVNNERICVIPDVDNEAGQTMAIEGLAPCPIIIRKYSMDGTQIDEPIVAGVMKAGYPYVLRYMDGVFLYEGELNVHAIVKEVSALPSDDEREQDQIDNDCRTIEYVVNPESPFTVEKLGELRQVLSGGEYEDITTSQLAIERCRWENWKKTRMNDGATITMLLLPFMEVNKKIRYTSPRTGERLTYIVKSVSMDFSGSTMTLELVRFYPYYIWQ